MILALTLSLFYALTSPTHAAEKPVCDSNVVTRKCEFFKEQKNAPYIVLPDGGRMINPLFKRRAGLVAAEAPEETAVNQEISPEEYDKMLLEKSELQKILETAPVSRRFRMAYVEKALDIGLDVNNEVLVPWPPQDEKAASKKVKVAEIQSSLQKSMQAGRYKALADQVKKMTDPVRQKKMVEAQKIQQLEAESLRREKAEEERQAKDSVLRDRKKARINELFKYVTDQMEAIVRRGRTDDTKLSKDELILIQKIKTTKLEALDSERFNNHPRCAGGAENAIYLPEEHTFAICPGKIMNSEADLVYAIAHELGHGVDQCGAKMPLLEVNYNKLAAALSDPNISSDYKHVYKQAFGSSPKYINADLNLATDPAFVKHLEDYGILKRVNSGVQSYPFQKEYNCFVDKNHFTEAKPKELQASIEFMERKMKGTAAWKANFTRKSVGRYKEALQKYPQCMQTMDPASMMRETMSDMMGALVAEKFILENPFKSESEKVAALTFARSACGSNSAAEMEQLMEIDSFPPNVTETMFTSQEYRIPHAEDDDRVKRIALNLPGMAEIYNCKRDVPSCIDHLSFSKRMSKKDPTKNSATTESGAIR